MPSTKAITTRAGISCRCPHPAPFDDHSLNGLSPGPAGNAGSGDATLPVTPKPLSKTGKRPRPLQPTGHEPASGPRRLLPRNFHPPVSGADAVATRPDDVISDPRTTIRRRIVSSRTSWAGSAQSRQMRRCEPPGPWRFWWLGCGKVGRPLRGAPVPKKPAGGLKSGRQ
jgi:hypothetical protein